MKKLTFVSVALFLVAAVTLNFMKLQHDEEAVKEVIVKGYVHGAFNELNPEAMAVSFHKDFAIFSPGKDGQIRRYPIANWIEATRKSKNDPNFDVSQNVWEHKFRSVDVSGKSAAVKLELFHNEKHVYTDYLSLLKFDDQWKIVAKVYHEHNTP